MRNSASVSVSSGLGSAPPASPRRRTSARDAKSVMHSFFVVASVCITPIESASAATAIGR